ncbi:MAG: winged helix DNA-binding protein [Dehalococcoidia bacterium]|jgi:DNA-binding MarR family transcriptional regulator
MNKTKNNEPHDSLVDSRWAIDIQNMIARVNTNHQIHINKLCSGQHITTLGNSILREVYEKGGKMCQKTLTLRLPVTKQAVTKTLKNLEELGFVKAKHIANDRRRREIRLTEEGLSVYISSLALLDSFFEKYTNRISKEEGEVLLTLLNKLNKFYKREINKFNKLNA